MLVITNTPATREEALRFPNISVICAASRLETSLVHFFKNRSGGFWDMDLDLQAITPDSPRIWSDYAARIRLAWTGGPPGALPAGRKTDRSLRAGMWLGFPVQGGGFGAAMLIEKPQKHQRFFADAVVMAMRRTWDRWPDLDDVQTLTPEDGAIVTQTSMICVRDGRWRVLGEHPNFDRQSWVWPIPWWQLLPEKRRGTIFVQLDRLKSIELKIDPAILALDPYAGERCRGMANAGFIELDVPRIINGTRPPPGGDFASADGIVTRERLKAWRAINSAIETALA